MLKMSSLRIHGRLKYLHAAGFAVAVVLLLTASFAPTAFGARTATRSEMRVMKSVWFTYCEHVNKGWQGDACGWGGLGSFETWTVQPCSGKGVTPPCGWGSNRTIVSTVDRRFGYGPGYGVGLNFPVFRRPTKLSRRWKVWSVGGGNPNPCSHWYRVHPIPKRVVFDLRITAMLSSSGQTFGDGKWHRC